MAAAVVGDTMIASAWLGLRASKREATRQALLERSAWVHPFTVVAEMRFGAGVSLGYATTRSARPPHCRAGLSRGTGPAHLRPASRRSPGLGDLPGGCRARTAQISSVRAPIELGAVDVDATALLGGWRSDALWHSTRSGLTPALGLGSRRARGRRRHDALLRRHGLQVTAQRLAVLRAVSDRPHSTADDIDKVVRAEIGAISRQAVYDALGVLTDKGLLRRIQPAGSPARYEDRVGDNHHHLICRTCSRMVDVDCAVGDTPCLTAADDSGYEIDEAEVIYWGRCPECVAATQQRATNHSRNSEQERTDVSDSGSESENPAIPSPTPKPTRPRTNQDWWPNQLDLLGSPPALAPVQSDGRGLQLRGGVQDPRPRRAEAGPRSR